MTNNQQSETYNRIKVMLVEQGKICRWLSEQIRQTEEHNLPLVPEQSAAVAASIN